MRVWKSAVAFAAFALCACATASAPAANPLMSDQFIADASAHVWNGRTYVYATNDSGNDGTYWNGSDWRLISSSDLAHWTDHGSIFSVAGFAWARELAWAPDAAMRDGVYYLYLPVDRTKIGVARADAPTGPFTDAIGGPLIDNARDANAGAEPIDPAVFMDDDGQAYLYFGTRVPKMVRLAPDMIHTIGAIEDVRIEGAPVTYGEAPWLHERDGVYYFSYSTGWPGQIVYATGASPAGPFTYRGVVLDFTAISTNHHAIVQRGDDWYIFYHTNALPGGGDYKRSISMDRLYHEADGAIRRVAPTAAGFRAAPAP